MTDTIILKGSTNALQTIDVRHEDDSGSSDNIPRSIPIAVSRVNDAGTHVATLSFTQKNAHIDLWDIRDSLVPTCKTKIVPCARNSFAINRDKNEDPPCLQLAISHYASWIAVFQTWQEYDTRIKDKDGNHLIVQAALPFRLYSFTTTFTPAIDSSPQVPELKFKSIAALRAYAGYGTFHFLSDYDYGNEAKETFVTCNALTVNVYNTVGEWSLILTMPLAPPDFIPPEMDKVRTLAKRSSRMLIESLRGPIFVWVSPVEISIWSLMTCASVTQIPHEESYSRHPSFGPTLVRDAKLSPDGTMLAVRHAYEKNSSSLISVYRTRTGTFIQEIRLNRDDISEILFVSNGDRLLVQFQHGYPCVVMSNLLVGSAVYPALLIPISSNCSLASTYIGHRRISQEVQALQSEVILVTRESTIGIYPFQESVVPADEIVRINPRQRCNGNCRSGAIPFKLKFCTVRSSLTGKRYELRSENSKDTRSVVLTKDGHEIMRTVAVGDNHEAYFLPCETRFIVTDDLYVQVWKLPTPSSPLCKLLLMMSELDTTYDTAHFSNSTVCRHGCSLSVKKRDPCDPLVWIRFSDHWLFRPDHAVMCIRSVFFLMVMYNDGSKQLQQAVLLYARNYINSYTGLKDGHDSLLLRILWLHHKAPDSRFLEDLLEFQEEDQPPWVPRSSLGELNPLSYAIKEAQDNPRVLSAARTLIDYCTRTAKTKKDIGYLSPILECLQSMTKLQPELALQAVSKMAFVPAKNPRYLVDQSIVCPKLSIRSFCLPFFQSSRQKYKCPVFQVESSIRPHQDKNMPRPKSNGSEYIVDDIYVAPFQMLWHQDSRPLSAADEATSWAMALLDVVLWKTKPKSLECIHTHTFTPEFFDNPAIEALVEYKWYAGLAASIHALTLFELRVIQGVCYVVTIILDVLRKIWGGRYDSVADKLESNDIAFHIMMFLYFFMTVVLMMNVLIALINVAFEKGNVGWYKAWVENRLLYVNNAESATFHIS
ncbi:hypothetical protein BGZ72_008226, partial [Mortierella alpina]